MFDVNNTNKSSDDNIKSNNTIENTALLEDDYKYRKPIWNPKSFAAISVLFSFFPAAILYSINYGRLGYPKKKKLYMILSFVGFALLISLTVLIPQTYIKAICMGINIGLGSYMMRDQLPLYKSHIENGGRKASLVLPIIGCLVLCGLFLGLYIYSANIPQTVLTFGGDELYYTQNIEKSDAERVGILLEKDGAFKDDGKTISLKLDKNASSYIISLVVNKQYINDQNVINQMKDFANAMSQQAFMNSKVIVNLCDNRFNVIKSVVSD